MKRIRKKIARHFARESTDTHKRSTVDGLECEPLIHLVLFSNASHDGAPPWISIPMVTISRTLGSKDICLVNADKNHRGGLILFESHCVISQSSRRFVHSQFRYRQTCHRRWVSTHPDSCFQAVDSSALLQSPHLRRLNRHRHLLRRSVHHENPQRRQNQTYQNRMHFLAMRYWPHSEKGLIGRLN